MTGLIDLQWILTRSLGGASAMVKSQHRGYQPLET